MLIPWRGAVLKSRFLTTSGCNVQLLTAERSALEALTALFTSSIKNLYAERFFDLRRKFFILH